MVNFVKRTFRVSDRMESAGDSLGTAIASVAERIGKLRHAFLDLELLRGNFGVDWSELEHEFAEREVSIRLKHQELLVKERESERRTQQVLDEISEREATVSDKEEQLVAEEQKLQQLDSKEIQPMDTDVAVDYSPVKREEPTLPSTATRAVEKSQVRVRPYLKSLCENMDGEGLRKYVVDHRKDMGALRIEMPRALQHAADPARIVLDAVQGYYQPVEQTSGMKEVATSANRRACILLLEALATVLGEQPVVPLDIKFLVRELAEQWKSKMDFQDGPDGNSLDAQAFLQLVASYGLSSEYEEEELCKLVLAVTRRKQTPALCKALNLSHKIPELVEHLTNDGKQIEALGFAHAFDMMGRIEPVALLKTYLKDTRKNKPGGNQHNDTVTRELAALKNVLKCIEDYHLEADYPPSPLHRRVAHLERTKSERKRTGGSVKGQAKRARNAGYERSFYNRSSDKPQVFNGATVSPYTLQATYDARTPGAYTTYTAAPNDRSRTPQSPYIYAVDGSVYASTNLYGTQSASYSTYQLAPGLPSPAPGYQPAFMH